MLVVWETSEPYQAVLEGTPAAGGALVCGLTLRHRSPSVANNYAVFLQVNTHVTAESMLTPRTSNHSPFSYLLPHFFVEAE